MLDQGQWQVGWMMGLMEEPPWSQLGRRPDRSARGTGLRPFAGLADQNWATTALAYVRELDTIATRRRELAQPGGGRHPPAANVPQSGDPPVGEESGGGAPKRGRPRQKKKD